MIDSLRATCERREALTKRLCAALHHFDRDVAIAIVASFIELDELENIVVFQEGRS